MKLSEESGKRADGGSKGLLKGELLVILLIFIGLLSAILGSQALIWFAGRYLTGIWLSEIMFFNLPIHLWISGQFLPLWFIILGGIFNYWMDRHDSGKLSSIIRIKALKRAKREEE